MKFQGWLLFVLMSCVSQKHFISLQDKDHFGEIIPSELVGGEVGTGRGDQCCGEEAPAHKMENHPEQG